MAVTDLAAALAQSPLVAGAIYSPLQRRRGPEAQRCPILQVGLALQHDTGVVRHADALHAGQRGSQLEDGPHSNVDRWVEGRHGALAPADQNGHQRTGTGEAQVGGRRQFPERPEAVHHPAFGGAGNTP